jgi:hypothetical protein
MKLIIIILTAILATIRIQSYSQTLYSPSTGLSTTAGVGIGIQAPIGNLHIHGSSKSSSIILEGSSTNQGGQTTTPAAKITNSELNNGGNSQIEFYIKPGAVTTTTTSNWQRTLFMNNEGAYFDVPLIISSGLTISSNSTIGSSLIPKTLTVYGTIVTSSLAGSTGANITLPGGGWLRQSDGAIHLPTSVGIGGMDCQTGTNLSVKGSFRLGSQDGSNETHNFSMGGNGIFGVDAPGFKNGRFYIDLNGNIGVGTTNTSTGYKIAVNGGIHCTEVKVDAVIPADYVFEPSYKLKSLGDVQKYVETNKHLPDVPSAAEFMRDGYKLSEMNELLLRKVEELTLYIIEMQKQIEAMKTVKQ